MPDAPNLTCPACGEPLVQIDNYGERLVGCLNCNVWGAPGSERVRKLPPEDVEALRSMRRQRDG
jgi:hypothetical protein